MGIRNNDNPCIVSHRVCVFGVHPINSDKAWRYCLAWIAQYYCSDGGSAPSWVTSKIKVCHDEPGHNHLIFAQLTFVQLIKLEDLGLRFLFRRFHCFFLLVLATGLSVPSIELFSFPCWINPSSRAVNQIFGVSSGMRLLPLTLDCKYACTYLILEIAYNLSHCPRSQVAYVTSPLLVPSWPIANVAISLVFWVYSGHSLLLHERVEYWVSSVSEFQ